VTRPAPRRRAADDDAAALAPALAAEAETAEAP
jgi:hypothetical protein